jgi:hypothetical protein
MSSPTEVKAAEIPAGTVFTMTVPLDRKKSKLATFHLKEMDEDLFMAARAQMDKNDFVAVRMIVKSLWLGGEPAELLNGNFIATQSAKVYINEMLIPVEGELKKN